MMRITVFRRYLARRKMRWAVRWLRTRTPAQRRLLEFAARKRALAADKTLIIQMCRR